MHLTKKKRKGNHPENRRHSLSLCCRGVYPSCDPTGSSRKRCRSVWLLHSLGKDLSVRYEAHESIFINIFTVATENSKAGHAVDMKKTRFLKSDDASVLTLSLFCCLVLVKNQDAVWKYIYILSLIQSKHTTESSRSCPSDTQCTVFIPGLWQLIKIIKGFSFRGVLLVLQLLSTSLLMQQLGWLERLF